jgi:hypothetical protein
VVAESGKFVANAVLDNSMKPTLHLKLSKYDSHTYVSKAFVTHFTRYLRFMLVSTSVLSSFSPVLCKFTRSSLVIASHTCVKFSLDLGQLVPEQPSWEREIARGN